MSSSIVGKLSVELGISDEKFRQAMAHAQTLAEQAARDMANKMNRAGSGGLGGFAQSFSRIADDAQYGFRGIINNMEQLGATAASAFGASTQSAMAFGGALTLMAIATNNVLPQLEKLTDTRSEWQKMADGPQAFAGSIMFATEKLKLLVKETQELVRSDATGGVLASVQRGLNPMKEAIAGSPKTVNQAWIGRILSDQLGIGSIEDQIKKNHPAGEKIARNRIDLGIGTVAADRDRSSYETGLKAIGTELAGGEKEIGKEYAEAFAQAAKGRIGEVRDVLTKQNMWAGMSPVEAEQQAIKTVGEASEGVKETFDKLAKDLPQFKLGEKLSEVFEAEAMPKRRAFMDQQNKERERLADQATSIRGRIDELKSRSNRSEIIGASDIFARNLNAGLGENDPVVKAIEKQTEDLSKVLEKQAGLD